MPYKNYEDKKAHSKQRYLLNKDKLKAQNKLNKEKNKEKIKTQQKVYRENNKEKIKEGNRLYENKRKLNDPLFSLLKNIRSSIRRNFKNNGYTKKSKSYAILGCTFEELKSHLEEQFEDWMNWENRGLYNGELNYGWDIDHIIPISSAKTEEDIIRLNHYTNLQPLCGYTNRYIKKNNLIHRK